MEEKIEVGSIVKSKSGNALRCGSGVYPDACVISVDPFIMASKSGDMRWSHFPMDDVFVVGKATEEQLEICMGRLDK